jgi:hypothetical protein
MLDDPPMIEERDYRRTGRQRAVALPLIFMVLVFVSGAALAAFAVHRFEKLARWLNPSATAVVVKQVVPAPTPTVAMQPVQAPAADPLLAAKVEALDDKVEAIDAQADAATGEANRAEGLLVAFATRRAIDRGQPLGYLEGLLRQHFGGTEASSVAMTIGSAQKPVTLLDLQNQLAELAPKLTAIGPQDSWWTGVRRELGNLFVVRKAQTPSTEPSEQYDRATRALAQGQVEAALREVARMPGARNADSWIGDARRYVLVHNALDRIEAAALLKPQATPII